MEIKIGLKELTLLVIIEITLIYCCRSHMLYMSADCDVTTSCHITFAYQDMADVI